MKNMIKILPSTNPCKEDKLVDYARELSNLGVEYLHCDVMDGKFVSNTCLSFDVVEKVRNNQLEIKDEEYLISQKIAEFVKEHYEYDISDDAIASLILYIKRVI